MDPSHIPKGGLCCFQHPLKSSKGHTSFIAVGGARCKMFFILQGTSWHVPDHWLTLTLLLNLYRVVLSPTFQLACVLPGHLGDFLLHTTSFSQYDINIRGQTVVRQNVQTIKIFLDCPGIQSSRATIALGQDGEPLHVPGERELLLILLTKGD